MNSTNPFGGKNPHGMYVPLTEDELEVIERLAINGDFSVVIKDWGRVDRFLPGKYDPTTWVGLPTIVFGDKRVSFYFRMSFTAPAIPQPNWYFDMEVWARGHKLFAQRMPTESFGKPIQLAAGMFLDLALDVALDRIDPAIVKEIKPGTIGLTTRHGNMYLDIEKQRLLASLQQGERRVRVQTAQEALTATLKQKKATD